MTCQATVRKYDSILVDEPPLLSDTDRAPNPVQLLLVALGTCQEIMYAAYAVGMGIRLEDVQVMLKGQLDLRGLFGLDPTVPVGYSRIEYETRLHSPEPEERLRQLQEVVEIHCWTCTGVRARSRVGSSSSGSETFSTKRKIF